MTISRPSSNEDDYFAREDAEKKRKLAVEHHSALDTAERERLRALHHQRCPRCGMELHTVKRSNVAVERCFNCQGMFLDEATLAKIVSEPKSGAVMSAILNWFKPAARS